MARMNISVSEEMRAEITRLGDKVNWSGLAQEAFAQEIARHSRMREPTMATVIERLRASKQKHLRETIERGREAGRNWAANTATYGELVRVSKLNMVGPEGYAWGVLRNAVDPMDRLENHELLALFLLDAGDVVDETIEAFVEGATAVFEEVEDQI